MLFTYEMEIQLGNGKKILKEIDGEMTVERNGDWTLALCCDDSNEYETVHDETDLYKDICKYLYKEYAWDVGEAIDAAKRNYRWTDREQARQ